MSKHAPKRPANVDGDHLLFVGNRAVTVCNGP